MNESKPLVNKDGEVRELLMEDIRKFQPIATIAKSSLVRKLGIEAEETPPSKGDEPDGVVKDAKVKMARARKKNATASKG